MLKCRILNLWYVTLLRCTMIIPIVVEIIMFFCISVTYFPGFWERENPYGELDTKEVGFWKVWQSPVCCFSCHFLLPCFSPFSNNCAYIFLYLMCIEIQCPVVSLLFCRLCFKFASLDLVEFHQLKTLAETNTVYYV